MRSQISLRSRLSLGVLVVALTAVAAALLAFYVSSRVMRDSLDSEISEIAAQLAAPAILGSGEVASIDPASVPGKYQVLIADASGNTVWSSVSSVSFSSLSPGWYSIDGYRTRVLKRSAGGVVAVVAPTADIDHSLSVALLALISASGVVILAVSLTLMWVYNSGVRPLSRMAMVANNVAAGAHDARVPEEGLPSEAALLASAVNNLLTAQERALSAEQHVASEQRRFLLDASHELRNPLTAILGWSDLLKRGAVPVDKTPAALERISSEASRMQRLCEQLLSLARTAARPPVSSARGDIAAALLLASSDHTAADDSRPVSVSTPESAFVVLDQDSCVQLCHNLFSNLRAHTPPGTSAYVEVSLDDQTVTLLYSDDGPGVPDPTKVFDRFYQADPSRSTKGTGLGLSVLREIVEHVGGSAKAASLKPHGFSLSLTLPAATPD